jgi:hypothetical protein
MKFVGKGWRALALVALVTACKGDGGTPPAAATSVAATSATTQTALVGAAVAEAPSVRVLDQRGDPMPNVTVSFSASSGGTVASPTAVTNASGIATAGMWTLGNTAGTQTLTATVASLPAVQFTATAQARVPAAVTATSSTTQTGLAGGAVAEAPTVRVNDQTGQPLAGVAVTFAVTAGGGQIATTTSTTGATGLATSGAWTLGTAGPNTVTATVAGLAPVQFNATASARTPSTVTATSPTTQTAQVGTAVGSPPAVRVNDQTGQPVAGVPVTFAVTAGGGTLVGANATTNAQGIATVTSWTLGAMAGQNTVTATVAGLAPVTFNATGAVAGSDPCDTATNYTLGSTVNGSLAATDCHLTTGEYVDFYGVTLTTAQALSFNMTSATLDSWLEMYDAAGNLVAVNDDVAADDVDATVRVFAPSGNYFLGASTANTNATGAYQLSSAALAGNVNCQENWIVPGVIIPGTIAATDCNFSGYLADEYIVVLSPGQTLTVKLESGDFDAYLELYDLDFNLIEDDDDGAGGTNSLLTYTYNGTGITAVFIDATTFDPGETGSYSLTVTRS